MPNPVKPFLFIYFQTFEVRAHLSKVPTGESLSHKLPQFVLSWFYFWVKWGVRIIIFLEHYHKHLSEWDFTHPIITNENGEFISANLDLAKGKEFSSPDRGQCQTNYKQRPKGLTQRPLGLTVTKNSIQKCQKKRGRIVLDVKLVILMITLIMFIWTWPYSTSLYNWR